MSEISRVKLAENLVSGVQYLSKRELLAEYSANNSLISLGCKDASFINSSIEWMKIEQVGICSNYSTHQYFSAIQKVLFSCHRPERSQIIFMLNGDGDKINMYLGVKRINEAEIQDSDFTFTENLSAYLSTLLPGSKVKYIKDFDANGEDLVKSIQKKQYRHLYSLTGIPSFMSKEGEEGLNTIENIVGPLSRKKFVYFVVADPVDEYKVNELMTKFLELAGKIESVKSFSISETSNLSVTLGTSDTITQTINESSSEGRTTKGKKHHTWCKIMSTIGLGDFVDQSTKTITKGLSQGNSHGESTSNTRGFSETSTMTLINKCAEYTADLMSKHAKRYNSGLGTGMWETGVYILTEHNVTAQSAAMQLRAVVSGKDTSLEPIRIHDLSKLLNTKNVTEKTIDAIRTFCTPNTYLKTDDNSTINSFFGTTHERLTTILTTEELTSYINLPQHSIPGISVVDYSSDFSLSPQKLSGVSTELNIGKLVYSGDQSNISIHLPLDTLSRHSLVCGVNGSGKTNTVLSILNGFMNANRPFLVIEPAKTEYVDWAIEYNKHISDPKKKIKIFIPGCERYVKGNFTPEKLKINPFEVIDLGGNEPRILSHIDRLKATFAAAFPMQDILPVVMEHLLYDLYMPLLEKDKDDPRALKNPTLSSINQDFIKNLMRNLGYAQENTQNISAALRTRFNSLKYGWKGEMLNNERLTGMEWSDLFDAPCVINLSYAGDDQDRAFMMSLLLQFLYEYRIAETETEGYSFNDNVCRHLVVVEEAHRVMGRCDNPELPQYKSGQMFSNFLSEVRAYGQGMMVVDQVPTRLIEDAIKNTNIKIIHKLVASDDSQRIAECIGLTPEQQKVIAKLSVGQAVLAGFNSANVMSDDCADVYLAQINKMK